MGKEGTGSDPFEKFPCQMGNPLAPRFETLELHSFGMFYIAKGLGNNPVKF